MKIAIIAMIIFPCWLRAQEAQPDLEAVSDQIAILQEGDDTSEEQYENISHLLSHPINLNKTTPDDLRFLNVLSESQIKEVIEHRNTFGPYISTLELQSLTTLDAAQLRLLLPYIRVRDPATELNRSLLSRIRNESDTYVLLRHESGYEQRRGFSSSTPEIQKFSGSQSKRYFRFRSSKPGDFSFGITAENDPGESFKWNPSQKIYGPDYLSFHAQTLNKGAVQNLVIGDYQAQFGQGLVWGGISGTGKNAETITSIRRCNVGYVPYTSAYEAGNLRGIASTVHLNHWLQINGSYSRLFRDGAITQNGEVSSQQYSGLHRNENELRNRKSFQEQVIGAIVKFQRDNFDGGLTLQQIDFSKSIEPEPHLYSRYAFRGTQNTNAGAYVNYTYKNISLFSEWANTFGHGSAFLLGSLLALTPKMDLSIFHRRYAQDYHPFFSNALSENTTAHNEIGTYWGWKYKFNRRWSHAGYVDFFRFPGLKFRTYAPSVGYEWLLRLNWQPTRSILVYLQAREESKARNISTREHTYQVLNTNKKNFWFTMDYGIGQKFRFKSRVLFSHFSSEHVTSAKGFAFAQDIGMHLNKWKISARYALFDTDDWDNRQYMYEQDVWLAYSLPAYDGTGVRKILVVEYKLNRTFTLWLRYAQTRYTDRKEIGSGMDQILGDTRNDVKLQVRIRF